MNSKRHSYLLTFGHACSDINQGALPAMLPFLLIYSGLNYAEAASLVFASSVVSALIQPLFGYLGDKVDNPAYMSLGIALAGAGIACMAFNASFWYLFCCALVSGTGIALFHPEGGKLANVVAGTTKGTGISNFAVGGNIGFALGPVLATALLSTWGMQGLVVFFVPAFFAAAILLTQTNAFRKITSQEVERIQKSKDSNRADDWVGFSKITALNTTRAIISNAFFTFTPLYWVAVLGQEPELAALMISVFALGGALASFFGGRIADRVGFKRIITISVGAIGPLIVLFLLMDQVIPAAFLLILCGIAQNLSYAPMVALSQEYLPNRIGFASGISLGVTVSMGGIASPILGAVGDVWGLQVTMSVVCVIALIGFGCACLLHLGRNRHEKIGAPPEKKK